jgi:hypothetical protein
VGPGPGDERFDGREEALTERCERVLDPRGHDRIHRAPDQAVPLELTHGQGEHALADAVDLASQLGEAPRAAPEQLDDEQRPLVGQAVEEVPDLARR